MNSWDCFDTLIARRYFHPKTVFDEVGKIIGDPNFKEKRVLAEKQSNRTYSDIYKRLPGIDPQIELNIELEHCFPIAENINKVQDGDMIVSDMYLPKNFIKKLLLNCGLDKDVDIIVTPKGKKENWIWKEIKKPELHTGDNLIADVENPKKYNIKTSYYTDYKLNETETEVSKINPHLAYWMRYVRLQCPYEDDTHKKVWLDQTNINLPVLALACFELPNNKPLAFTYRDCNIWHPLYEQLINNESYRLDCSRKMYLNPNKYFYEYTSFIRNRNIAIVDLGGIGSRPVKFFGGPNKSPELIYLVSSKKAISFVKTLVPSIYPGSSLEKHNCYDKGTVVGWDKNGPIRKENDHPPILVETHSKAKKFAVDSVKHFNIYKNTELLRALMVKYREVNFTHKNFSWEGDH
jgi:hypothetical protein